MTYLQLKHDARDSHKVLTKDARFLMIAEVDGWYFGVCPTVPNPPVVLAFPKTEWEMIQGSEFVQNDASDLL